LPLVNPLSVKLGDVETPTFVYGPLWTSERRILYPVAPLAAVQLKLIWVLPSAVAARFVGAT
jgi:hypothetical protein